ncbi:DNA-binding response regulator [Cupriavidus sp. USMAA2-4]|uniref:DNA-binding response regulator n=1 Tax=Cupriavidus malaysiensis TaxID=367825 RepID=A0ABM6FAE1_9BURK|nr:DNA-binding response regulator [Cupriavidus sp. USMAA2-4]AOZ01619.1 DNA-binding response regulator [Cupriavidus sp. USMAHM13]AOZ08643.1 DNA-binding response regulator [Cupriavidus malaysiensis]
MSNAVAQARCDALVGLRILVVDDNPDDRRLLAEYLGAKGSRVYLAEDGHDGFRKALAILPDLILLDVGMPVCDGLTASRLLKSAPDTRAIPIIFLTAAGRPAERVQGLQSGAIDYIVKPFELKEVSLRLSIHARAGRHGREADPNRDAGADTGTAGSSALDAHLFRDARRHLLSRLHETPALPSLASALSTNALRLNLAFKRCAGVTVLDFLFEARMQYAASLLTRTTIDIQAVASATGYTTRQNFSTAYRRRFGMSPNESRQQYVEAAAVEAVRN